MSAASLSRCAAPDAADIERSWLPLCHSDGLHLQLPGNSKILQGSLTLRHNNSDDNPAQPDPTPAPTQPWHPSCQMGHPTPVGHKHFTEKLMVHSGHHTSLINSVHISTLQVAV